MRKKIMTLFITIGLTVSLLACGNDNGNQADSSTDQAFLDNGAVNEEEFDEEAALKEISMEVTDCLTRLISCDAYVDTMGGSEELKKVIEGWKTLKIDKSKPICVIKLNLQDIEDYLSSMMGEEEALSEMPKEIKEYLYSKVSDSMGNMLNGRMGGVSVLAASSVARYSKTYVPKHTVENQVWIIPCNDEISLCVSFTNTGNDVLTVSTTYIVFTQEVKDMVVEYGSLSMKEIEW